MSQYRMTDLELKMCWLAMLEPLLPLEDKEWDELVGEERVSELIIWWKFDCMKNAKPSTMSLKILVEC